MAGKALVSLPSEDDDGELPNFIDDVRNFFGDDVADKIIDHLGGTKITIPSLKKLKEDTRFVQVVGLETAKAISELLLPASTAYTFIVPMRQTQNSQILRKRITELLMQDGMSARRIARACGVHERQVWRQRAFMKKAGMPLGKSLLPKESQKLGIGLVSLQEEPARLVEILLLEGFAPSLLRQYLRLSGGFITEVRNNLIKEGRLDHESAA